MWPSNMSSSSRDFDCDNGNKCGKCQNHDFEVLKKGHARDCPFKKCMCLRCRLLDARSDILQVISGKETKLKGTKKDPNCGYCQNHGVKILRKGHVRSCGFGQERHFQRDNCFDCEVHFIRNEVNRLQIKMRRAMKEDKNLTEEQRRTAREAITREEVEKVCNMARCARERRESTTGLSQQEQEQLQHQQQQPQQALAAALDDTVSSVWRPWSSADHSVAVQLSLGALTSMAMNQYYLNHMSARNNRSNNGNSNTTTQNNSSGNTQAAGNNSNNNNNININDNHNGVVNYTLNQLFAVGGATGDNHATTAMMNIMQQQHQRQLHNQQQPNHHNNPQQQHNNQQQQQQPNHNGNNQQQHYNQQQQQRDLQQQLTSSSPLSNAVACDLSLDKHLRRATTN